MKEFIGTKDVCPPAKPKKKPAAKKPARKKKK